MSTVTAAEVLATARSVYDMGLIYREAYDWTSYVSIQEKAPYNDGRFPRGVSIAHCGVSVAYVLWRAGMVAGVDYPDLTAMQFAPYLAQRINVVGDPEPGDIVVFDFQHDGVEDHIGLAVDTSGLAAGTITVWQANSIPGGRVVYADVPTTWIAGYVRPDYADASAGTGPDVETLCARFFQAEGFSDAGIAGALANWWAESKFDPAVVEGGGYDLSVIDDVEYSGVGLGQWSRSRRVALFAFAAAMGRDWRDVDVQLAYTRAEVASRGDFQALWARMATASDPLEASRDFDAIFEGSGIKGDRIAAAADFYIKVRSGQYWDGTTAPSPRNPQIDDARRAVPAYC